jgi:integrase
VRSRNTVLVECAGDLGEGKTAGILEPNPLDDTPRERRRPTRCAALARLGGREARIRYGGSFATKREATIRAGWIAGELAAHRVPELGFAGESPGTRMLREAAERWQESRVDVSENTRLQHRSAVRMLLPLLGDRRVDAITTADVADVVATLTAKGKARETVRKSLVALAMILDHEGIAPNPARDKVKVCLPRQDQPEINPPTAAHVIAVHALLPPRYRLPLIVLDATGMRVGELERLTWGDVDEPRQRWRVSRAVSKTRRARWVSVPPIVFRGVCALVTREDRVPERRIFQGFGGDRFRTAVSRACTAAGIPSFSPHDLRHRRISLLHLAGVPWARIGEHVGQRNLAVTANTYSHVLADEAELDYAEFLRRT